LIISKSNIKVRIVITLSPILFLHLIPHLLISTSNSKFEIFILLFFNNLLIFKIRQFPIFWNNYSILIR
jgi:hypothetical protein